MFYLERLQSNPIRFVQVFVPPDRRASVATPTAPAAQLRAVDAGPEERAYPTDWNTGSFFLTSQYEFGVFST